LRSAPVAAYTEWMVRVVGAAVLLSLAVGLIGCGGSVRVASSARRAIVTARRSEQLQTLFRARPGTRRCSVRLHFSAKPLPGSCTTSELVIPHGSYLVTFTERFHWHGHEPSGAWIVTVGPHGYVTGTRLRGNLPQTMG
jgi:hypothetical protein